MNSVVNFAQSVLSLYKTPIAACNKHSLKRLIKKNLIHLFFNKSLLISLEKYLNKNSILAMAASFSFKTLYTG